MENKGIKRGSKILPPLCTKVTANVCDRAMCGCKCVVHNTKIMGVYEKCVCANNKCLWDIRGVGCKARRGRGPQD